MNMLRKLKQYLAISFAGIAASPMVFALKGTTPSTPSTSNVPNDPGSTGVTGGMTTIFTYLQYGMWAISAAGIIAVGFMMMFNVQEAMLKNVGKIVAVIVLITLGFSAPTWFGLNIVL